MHSFWSVVCTVGLLGTSFALPINTTTVGDRNAVLFGFLAFIGISAILGACVCCRRRKRGFEEFENESGSADPIRSEFPIFRALSSPENSNYRTPAINPHANVVQNNIQQDEFDNNNGPISPADMENIENNNAVDYIPNRNEVGIVVEQVFTVNRNLTSAAPESISAPYITLDIEPPEPNKLSDNMVFESVPTDPFENDDDDDDDDHLNATNPFHTVDLDEINEIKFDSKYLPQTLESYNITQNPFVDDNNQNEEINGLKVKHKMPIMDCQTTQDIEIVSGKSSESEKSEKSETFRKCDSEDSSTTDVNSVEEALRALDFAISGEDSFQPDEDGDSDGDSNLEEPIMDESREEFHKAFRQILIDKYGMNLADEQYHVNSMKIVDEGKYSQNIYLLENVKEEAKLLVDSVIEECQIVVNRKIEETENASLILQCNANVNENTLQINAKHNCNNNNNTDSIANDNDRCNDKCKEAIFFLKEENDFNQTIIDGRIIDNISNKSSEISDNVILDVSHNTSECSSNIDTNVNKSNINLDDSFEQKNIYDELFSLASSTPSVNHKFMSTNDIVEQKKLFNDDSFTKAAIVEGLAIINDDTFNLSYCQQQNMNPIINFENSINSDANVLLKNDVQIVNNSTFSKNSVPYQNATFTTDANDVNDSKLMKNDQDTFNVTLTEINSTYTATNNQEKETKADATFEFPILKIDHEENLSVNLSTVTPVNTPIELNYSLDSWDKFISNSLSQQQLQHIDINQPCTSMQAANSGWFLHPQPIHTVTANDTYEMNDDDDDDNLDQTYDALRKQLAEALPHAQGMSGPPEFHDDFEDDDLDERSPTIEETIPQTEMVINYKRPLSPIMEESEDETCKTFIMNETKYLDSTSTGCIETGEAIMGVTKTLMASNDTLFNFEDTLGERDDIFSPRAESQLDLIASTSRNEMKTPTSEKSSDTEIVKSFKSMEFAVADVVTVNDLLSPDQPKTFSDETITVEHVSSDLSGTIDATVTTNTLEDKTCISVHPEKDERISEISEPEWDSTSLNVCDLNTFADIPSLDVQCSEMNEIDVCQENTVNVSTEQVDENVDIQETEEEEEEEQQQEDEEKSNNEENKRCLDHTSEISKYSGNNDDFDERPLPMDTTRTFLNNEITFSSSQLYNNTNSKCQLDIDNTKENDDPNLKQNDTSDFTDSTKIENSLEAVIRGKELLYEPDLNRVFKHTEIHLSEKTAELHKHLPIMNNYIINEIDLEDDHNYIMVSDDRISQLSGEEDPWAHPIADIRFNGPANEIMSTSFTTNEWDSDIDDSNSSEEFMYVKGTPPPVPSPDIYKHQIEHKNGRINSADAIPEEDIDSVWNKHKDKVPISSKGEDECTEIDSENSSSDVEGEWVPSSWDSMAQPSRSAMKSPDKSSSTTKKRRSVAFKKQNYHSVYEYPRENLTLSPSYSEPHIWDRDFPNLRIDTTVICTNLNSLDGFTISSSTKPFHGSQFNAQCHTWPTDIDFSWSQVQFQNQDERNDKYLTNSELQLNRPKNLEDLLCTEKTKDKVDGNFARPDSGVGESAELLSESMSLGDLCHTKSSLRLPLKLVPVDTTEMTGPVMTENAFNDERETNIVSTTPSCTGSMDSLSSSSGSERQVSFTTFGKTNPIFEDDRLNEEDLKQPGIVLIENENILDVECPTIKNKHDRSTKQNDSTDEDSGIESIMRITKDSVNTIDLSHTA